MLNRLFDLENIKYVISVDDCFMDINEAKLREEVSVFAVTSFGNIKDTLQKFGKTNEVDEIEDLLGLGQDASIVIQELINSLSAEEIKECSSIITSGTGTFADERAEITAFLEKLKEDGLIEKYVTLPSTHEAEAYDPNANGMTNGAVLWLIDKSFANAGESTSAGLELAKNKVKNCKCVDSYVFILTNINSTSEKEEDIAKDFDQLLVENGVECPSFIYYIPKSKVRGLNLDRVAKSLAFGFKRKQCYMLMDIYIECLRDSCTPTIDALRKIDQKTLDYVFLNKVEGNGESYFDFIARLVQIFHESEYTALLTNKQAEIHKHIQFYQEIGQRAPQGSGNLLPINEELAKVRRKELYDENINIRFSEILTGDIFEIREEYYILVTQSCDTVLRKEGKRKLKQAILLKIEDAPGGKYKYELSCFCNGNRELRKPAVVFQDYKIVPFEILDLCASTIEGIACIDIKSFERDLESKCVMTPNYIKRYEIIKGLFSKIYSQKLLLDNHFNYSNDTTDLAEIKEAYDSLLQYDNSLKLFDIKDGLMTYSVRRIARLNELSTVELLKEYGNVLSRVGQPFDFMKSDCAD